ncbi:G-protein coupled receptor GRL101-like [Diadema antillarum]|uniref:G-protein coupled receptor GRL101-like n=1 Tax=Diadema antillarum TaxID=105358 RepID=UPI003A89D967
MSNTVLRLFIWVLGSSAFIGNAFVVGYRLLHSKRGRKSSVQGSLITNLAISDFLMGLYMITIAAADLQYRGKYALYADEWQSSFLCKLAGITSVISSEASVCLVMMISIDRCCHVMAPFNQKIHLSLRGAHYVELTVWILALSVSLPPALIPSYVEGSFYGQSGVCLALPLTANRHTGWLYSVLLFIGVTFCAFLVTLMCYVAIFVSFRISKHKLGKVGRGSQEERRLGTEIKMAAKMALVVGTDLLCWMPVIIMGIMSAAGKLAISSQVYAWISVFILPVNSSLNPYLYTLSSVNGSRKRAFPFIGKSSGDHTKGKNYLDDTCSSLVTSSNGVLSTGSERMREWLLRNKRPFTQEELMILTNDLCEAASHLIEGGIQADYFLNLDSVAVQTDASDFIARAFLVIDPSSVAAELTLFNQQKSSDKEEKEAESLQPSK